MKKYIFILAALVVAVGCVKKDLPENPVTGGNENNEDHSPFPYTTAGATNVRVSYVNMDGIAAPVYFEIYDTCPVTLNAQGTSYVKIEGIEPLFAATTGQDGIFSGEAELPLYLKKCYVYSPDFYARTLIEAEVSNGTLTATDAFELAPEADAATRASYSSEAVTKDKWKTYLGTYDSNNGKIKYAYNGELKYSNYASLYTAHSKVININKPCPEDFRSSFDPLIKEDAHVAVTFLGTNTCWNCSMGYYFYRDGETPASLAEANVIMVFPNTQDGMWSVDPGTASRYKGIDRGTAVQLMFYPNINDKSTATPVFPAGYRIGFVLANNAWTNRLPNFRVSKAYRAATSAGLSVDDNKRPFNSPRTAVYRYINDAQKLDAVMFSFEDYTTDENFSDVVFTLVSNPVKAVEVPPTVTDKDEKRTAKILKGIYAFEDLWPSRGDYDMNDVMVKSDYEKVYNDKGIYEESFLLTTYNNMCAYENGLALTLGGAATSAKLTLSVKAPQKAGEPEPQFVEESLTRDGNVLLLNKDVRLAMGSTYKITASYTSPVQQGGSIKPFIYNTTRDKISAGKRWELHLPYEAPTDKAEMWFFGRNEDRSVPAEGIYYVRRQMYPFAFFLSGANNNDLAPMLDTKNETKAIDLIYTDYPGWVTSQGANNKDWYKKK